MVVDKRLTGDPAAIDEEFMSENIVPENIIDVPTDDEILPEDISIIEDDEGGVVVDFDPSQMMGGDGSDDFFANLAETVDSRELTKLGNDLSGYYREDKQGRKDWEMTYVEGLDLLDFKYEEREQPFKGASGFTSVIGRKRGAVSGASLQGTFAARWSCTHPNYWDYFS